nr:hypothetical protein [Microlunatus sp. Gsoil 973]
MSRMSLTSRPSRSVLSRAMPIIRRACGDNAPSRSPDSRPSDPRIAVSGVRSSWLTTETNSCFIRSTSRREVMSRKTITAPGVLVSLCSGLDVTSTGISRPFGPRYRSSSPLVVSPVSIASAM